MGQAHPQLRCDGPAIVFGGPYGNLEATRALLAESWLRQQSINQMFIGIR